MSRLASLLADGAHPGARPWVPPEIGRRLEPGSESLARRPTTEEVAAIEEEARATGRAAGYEAGYQAGYREGCDQASKEAEDEQRERQAREAQQRESDEQRLRETVTALEGIAEDLTDPLARALDELEPELLLLVVTLAKRLIMDELSIRPELVQRVLRQALNQLPSRSHPLRLHLHPDDQAVLAAYAESQGEHIAWLPDAAVERGGCVLESGPSRIDASLETRLQQTIDALWGELAPLAEATPPEPLAEPPTEEV